jgi:phospholipid/cholesterol/gamma-HCH transport system ATP-binding protein
MAIEIVNIIKGFGEKQVLKGIDFKFELGKVNMIIGASGSGKSVMMKCIVGLMRPDGGQILYDGVDLHSASFKEVRNLRKNMGMLFQYSALFDSMTVEENVGFPLKLFTKMTAKETKKRVEFCLDRVNMANTNHLFPAELSGGMMKRVGIARAIALNPKYLFCDEPNSGLDPLTSKVIDELIMELTKEFNTCTVVVSHDMNSVINISDNIMFLYKGEKAWEGSKRAIMRSGNPNLDKFVFVSDLINRDLYDHEPEATPVIDLGKPAEIAAPVTPAEEAPVVPEDQAPEAPATDESATPPTA